MQTHCITEALAIEDKDINVIDVYKKEGVRYLVVARDKAMHQCPRCGKPTQRVHDYRTRTITHAAYTAEKGVLLYRRRRYVCGACGKRFPERNAFVGRYERISYYTKLSILKDYGSEDSFKRLAERHHVSSSTVIRQGERHINPKRLTLPEVLSIDEFKNARTGKGKYACLLADPIRKRPLDVLPTRRIDTLRTYFSRIPKEERAKVKYVTGDLWDPYRRIVKTAFPNAIYIADKFHFARYIYWALNDVRIRVMKQQRKGSVRYHILKKHWKLMNKYTFSLSLRHFYDYKLRHRITPREIVDMARQTHPDLKKAIDLKDTFHEALSTMTRDEATTFIDEFIHQLRHSRVPELRNVIKTFRNWKQEIINAFPVINPRTGEILEPALNNAVIEGFNNKIKVIKRVSYGFRNFWNFRRKIMTAFNPEVAFTFSKLIEKAS